MSIYSWGLFVDKIRWMDDPTAPKILSANIILDKHIITDSPSGLLTIVGGNKWTSFAWLPYKTWEKSLPSKTNLLHVKSIIRKLP